MTLLPRGKLSYIFICNADLLPVLHREVDHVLQKGNFGPEKDIILVASCCSPSRFKVIQIYTFLEEVLLHVKSQPEIRQ